MKKLPRQSKFIQRMYVDIPSTYELLNHLLTLGLDILWRKKAAKRAAQANGNRLADMCTGTGETAVYLKRFCKPHAKIYGIDFSLPMMTLAKNKHTAKTIHFTASDIKALPFADESFDVITISFATRNLNVTQSALLQSFSEFYRVLKPGGHFINLETSQPSYSMLRKGFHLYIRLFVKLLGSIISGSSTAYTYLARSMELFYSAEKLTEIIRQAGFNNVQFQRLFLGAAAIHYSRKV